MRSLVRLGLSLCLFCSTGTAARGASVDVTGSAGTPGIDGTAGNPGGDGSAGGPGGPAVATANNAADDTNIATAHGGAGGSGGNGGAGVPAGSPAGNGGAGGRGGDATATATTDSPPGTGQVTAIVGALAGNGGPGGLTPGGSPGASGDGGNALASGEAIAPGAREAYASVGAVGGDGSGSAGSHGGVASLGTVRAQSDTGNAVIQATVQAGNSGLQGTSANVVDAIDAQTAGDVSLSQTALAGSASQNAGDGSSELTKSVSSHNLSMTVQADGGTVVDTFPESGDTHAGSALAKAVGTNNTGGVQTYAYAYGGGNYIGVGGNAEADATSSGNGASAFAHAEGGKTFDNHGTVNGTRLTGDALAQSIAIGSGTIHATAEAIGDQYNLAAPTSSLVSYAIATSDASAISQATTAGVGTTMLSSARSNANLGSSATADVHTLHGVIYDLHSQSLGEMDTNGMVHAAAWVGQTETVAQAAGHVSEPQTAGVYMAAVDGGTPWLAGNPHAIDSLHTADPNSENEVVAQGLFSGTAGTSDWNLIANATLNEGKFNAPRAFNVKVGFLDSTFSSDLHLLTVQVLVNGTSVASYSFGDSASAEAGLDDLVLAIDPALYENTATSTFEVRMAGQSDSATDGFFSNFVLMATVPEPAPLALFALGITLLALRRRLFA